MLAAGRNRVGLTERQIAYCKDVWAVVCVDGSVELDDSEAHRNSSRTRFDEVTGKVHLGADAWPGDAVSAISRLSTNACLVHELAHAERYELGYRRPLEMPDVLIDEAETSLRASLSVVLGPTERADPVEDARDRLIAWLALARQEAEGDEG